MKITEPGLVYFDAVYLLQM